MSFNQRIEKMTPRHYKILDYSVAGLTARQIAVKLEMSRVQVGIVISSPSFQHQFGIRRKQAEEIQDSSEAAHIDEVKTVLQENAKAAADKLVSGMISVDEKIALKSATEILDRSGYPKEQKVSGDGGNNTQIIINSADLSNLKESLNMDSS